MYDPFLKKLIYGDWLAAPYEPKTAYKRVELPVCVRERIHPSADKYAGQAVTSRSKLNGPTLSFTSMCTIDGNVVEVDDSVIVTEVAHSFANTGMRRSWCTCCGAEGQFNWLTGQFE